MIRIALLSVALSGCAAFVKSSGSDDPYASRRFGALQTRLPQIDNVEELDALWLLLDPERNAHLFATPAEDVAYGNRMPEYSQRVRAEEANAARAKHNPALCATAQRAYAALSSKLDSSDNAALAIEASDLFASIGCAVDANSAMGLKEPPDAAWPRLAATHEVYKFTAPLGSQIFARPDGRIPREEELKQPLDALYGGDDSKWIKMKTGRITLRHQGDEVKLVDEVAPVENTKVRLDRVMVFADTQSSHKAVEYRSHHGSDQMAMPTMWIKPVGTRAVLVVGNTEIGGNTKVNPTTALVGEPVAVIINHRIGWAHWGDRGSYDQRFFVIPDLTGGGVSVGETP